MRRPRYEEEHRQTRGRKQRDVHHRRLLMLHGETKSRPLEERYQKISLLVNPNGCEDRLLRKTRPRPILDKNLELIKHDYGARHQFPLTCVPGHRHKRNAQIPYQAAARVDRSTLHQSIHVKCSKFTRKDCRLLRHLRSLMTSKRNWSPSSRSSRPKRVARDLL